MRANYRLELAVLIPSDRKLTLQELQVIVVDSAAALNKGTIERLIKGAVQFDSLQDLQDYGVQLDALRKSWNKKMKERDAKK